MYAYIYKRENRLIIMGFIKKFLIKRALKTASNKSDMQKIADDTLKDAMQELRQTNKTANTLLQAKLIKQESKNALDKIREFDDEEYEEQEEKPDIQDTIISTLLQNFLGNKQPKPDDNLNLEGIAEVAKNLTPEQKEEIKKNFLK